MDLSTFWIPFSFALIGLGWLAVANFWLFAWSRPDVERWANEHGFRLVHWRRLYFLIGQPVYQITVEDRSGLKRTAIMHAPSVISRFFGLGKEPKVRWLD